jgi:hypothetical protein
MEARQPRPKMLRFGQKVAESAGKGRTKAEVKRAGLDTYVHYSQSMPRSCSEELPLSVLTRRLPGPNTRLRTAGSFHRNLSHGVNGRPAEASVLSEGEEGVFPTSISLSTGDRASRSLSAASVDTRVSTMVAARVGMKERALSIELTILEFQKGQKRPKID